MGLFDGQMNFADPNTLALLGATAALGDASMPSRLPIPTGALLAKAAGGLAAGSQAYKNQLEQQQANAASLTNAQTRATIDALRGRLGMQPITDEELKSGNFSGGGIYGNIGGAPQQSAISAPTPTETAPANIVAPAAGAAPAATDSSGGTGTLGPNQTVIASTLAGLGHSPAQIAGALGWGSAESPGKNGDTNTAAVNNTGRDGQFGGAFGWQQWLAERRDALNVFAQQNGGSVTDPVIQAKFFDHEMKTPGSGAGTLAQEAYASATTPADAVTAMAHYGRGQGYTADNPQGTVGFGTRLASANHIFGGLGGNTQVAQAAPTTITDMPQSAVGGTSAGSGQAPTLPPPAVKMGDVSPAQNAQNVQNLPPDFRTMFTNRLINGAMGFKATPLDDYFASAANFPLGSPQQRLYLDAATHAAGIEPFIGGARPGVPGRKYNVATGNYDIAFQNPRAPEGASVNADGSMAMLPGGLETIQAGATAHAAGAATFKPQEFHGPFGQNYLGTALGLPSQAAIQPQPPTPLGGVMAPAAPSSSSQPIAAPAAVRPVIAPPLRPEAAAPAFPVQTPQGAKDVSQVTVSDMFPNGEGIPKPPIPPPGMGYGPPSTGEVERQKKDTDRLEKYAAEAAGNPEVYQNLAHLRDILGRGLNTNITAPMWADVRNIAQGMGVDLGIPASVDPNDAAAFNKAATRLVFAGLSKFPGQIRNMEITGLGVANPNLTLPISTNYSVLNDVLSVGKWQDARARLAQQYFTETGGAPLSAFDAKFNQIAPLADITDKYRDQLRAAGARFPGDKESSQPSSPAAPVLKHNPQTGQVIELRNGQWVDHLTGKPVQ